MNNEDKILMASWDIANTVTSMHFHNAGLMDDQVDPEEWDEYTCKVHNAILDTVDKYNE